MRTTIYTCDVCGGTLKCDDGQTFDTSLGWRRVSIDWVLTSFSEVTTTKAHLCSDKCALEFVQERLPAFVGKRPNK